MGRSHLLCADRQPGTRDLRWDALRVVYHEPVSTVIPGDLGGHFINVAPAIAPGGVPGLPFDGPAVLMWGSGHYRESNVTKFGGSVLSIRGRSGSSASVETNT